MSKMRINNRFVIDFSSRELADGLTNSKTILEPRIAQLLRILMENSEKVVERTTLIEVIWKNYGSGEELLTHSISVLRKVLDDTSKKQRIIQTVPKTGYKFTGVISLPEVAKKNALPSPWQIMERHPYLSFCLLVIFMMLVKAVFWPHH